MIQSLLTRAEQIDALAEALPAQILANRSRREGRPVTLSKSAQRTINWISKHSQQMNAELPALIAGLSSESVLVETALESERDAMKLDCVAHTGGHPEDESIARPLLELRATNIAELEAFVLKTRQQRARPRDNA